MQVCHGSASRKMDKDVILQTILSSKQNAVFNNPMRFLSESRQHQPMLA